MFLVLGNNQASLWAKGILQMKRAVNTFLVDFICISKEHF